MVTDQRGLSSPPHPPLKATCHALGSGTMPVALESF